MKIKIIILLLLAAFSINASDKQRDMERLIKENSDSPTFQPKQLKMDLDIGDDEKHCANCCCSTSAMIMATPMPCELKAAILSTGCLTFIGLACIKVFDPNCSDQSFSKDDV